MSSPEEHPFLTARHVDNLVDAVHALVRILSQESIDRARNHRETLTALQLIANHTANLPALIAMMDAKLNGGLDDATEHSP